MIRHWLSLSVLIVITLLFVILWDSPPGTLLPHKSKSSDVMIVTTTVTNAIQQRFNTDGKPSYLFTATEVRHLQAHPGTPSTADYSEFTLPNLTLYNDPTHPWYITANNGWSNEAGTEVTLKGNVVIWKLDAEGQRSQLTTSVLNLKPDQQYAETNKPVIITAANSKINAVGMKAFFQEDRVELLSRVRGIHDPTKKQ